MKSIRTDPANHAPQGDERIRTAVPAPSADPVYDRCGCRDKCGDDGDIDGPGTCKGLPRMPEPPLVEIVLVPRRGALS